MTKQTLLVATLSFLIISCHNEGKKTNQIIATTPVENIKTASANPKTIAFEIEGMTCAVGCANLIEGKLSKLGGIVEAKVDFESKTATVTYDANKLDQEKITKAVEAVGGGKLYKVVKMKS